MRFLWCQVWLPESPHPVSLVIARHPLRTKPWRLLTILPVLTRAQALRVLQIYARRWQVEWTIRFHRTAAH